MQRTAPDDLVQRIARFDSARPVAALARAGLAILDRVYPAQANRQRTAVMPDGQAVAVDDADRRDGFHRFGIPRPKEGEHCRQQQQRTRRPQPPAPTQSG